MKIYVQALERPGFDGSFRAGKKWPSGTATEVEVVETKDGEDPPQEEGKGIRIGTKSLKMLEDDRFLKVSKGSAPPASGGDAAKDARIRELEAEVARLKGEGHEKEPARKR